MTAPEHDPAVEIWMDAPDVNYENPVGSDGLTVTERAWFLERFHARFQTPIAAPRPAMPDRWEGDDS